MYRGSVIIDNRLEKIDISALKTADSIVFYWQDQPGPWNDTPGFGITCIKNADPSDPWKYEARHTIHVSGRVQSAYDDDHNYDRAVTSISGSECNQEWQTCCKALRAGDEIRLEFYAEGYSSQMLKAAGIYADVLYLECWRDGKLAGRWLINVTMTQSPMSRMFHQPEYSFVAR